MAIARFNVLAKGLSRKRKDVKTPLSKLTIADHAINRVAKSRFAERRLKPPANQNVNRI